MMRMEELEREQRLYEEKCMDAEIGRRLKERTEEEAISFLLSLSLFGAPTFVKTLDSSRFTGV